MNLTPELFEKACRDSKGSGVWNLHSDDIVAYSSILQEALDGGYSESGSFVYGVWRCNLTEPLSLDYMYNKFNPYEITLDRIDTIEKLAHWVDHLHCKVWFNWKEVAKYCRTRPESVRDAESPLHFFQGIVTLNRRGSL